VDDDPRSRRRSDYPVLRAVPLRWGDVDTYGHVNNVVHYALMDTLINGWMGEQVGVDIRTGLSGYGVVVETGCRYFRELHFGGTPVLGLRLDRVSRSSVVYEVGFFLDDPAGDRDGDGGPLAVGRFVHVYVGHDTRRPVAVPVSVRAALERLRPRHHDDRTTTQGGEA
jgi:acyl-CoA thioester hydrolase